MRYRLLKWIPLGLLVVMLAGCGDRVQVQIPPKAPVEGIRTVAVLPFESVAADPALGFEFEDRIASELRKAGWYNSVITYRVSSSTVGGYTASQLQTADMARKAGSDLNADAVIVGTATYYFEDVFMNVPQCAGCNRPDTKPTWSVNQQTNVIVHLTARMIDVKTGREIQVRRSVGEDVSFLTHYLSWSQHDAPPTSLVPLTNRQHVPATRSVAIDRAVRDFTHDLLPTYEWRSLN